MEKELIPEEQTCEKCHSEDSVEFNTTNYAALYWCSNCRKIFNPTAWECPSCEEVWPVSLNPFDDPYEYYCYDCDFAFNRLAPTIETPVISHETEVSQGETSEIYARLVVDKKDSTTRGVYRYGISLQNAGDEQIQTQGRQPIAFQYQVTDDSWWTIYGNPQRFTPPEKVTLEPGEQLQWEISINPFGTSAPEFFKKRKRMPSGTYRFVYWGLLNDRAVGAQLPVEFEYW